MSMNFETVAIHFFSLKNFQDEKIASNFFETLNKYGDEFIPDKFDYYEPPKRKYNSDDYSDALDMWLNTKANEISSINEFASSHMIMKKSKGYKVEYNVTWKKDNTVSFNTVSIIVDLDYFNSSNNVNVFVEFFKELTSVIEPAYATVRNAKLNGWDEPINLTKCLPSMGWITVFGSPYIQMFGKEQLLNAPLFRVNEISDNLVCMQSMKTIFEPIEYETQSKIKEYLGEICFAANGKDYRSCKDGKVPSFDYSEILFDSTKPIIVPQIKTRKK